VEDNCAGVVVKKMSQDFSIKNNLDIKLEKKGKVGLLHAGDGYSADYWEFDGREQEG